MRVDFKVRVEFKEIRYDYVLNYSWLDRDCMASTTKLFLNHTIGQLKACPGSHLVHHRVRKDHDVWNMSLPIIMYWV